MLSSAKFVVPIVSLCAIRTLSTKSGCESKAVEQARFLDAKTAQKIKAKYGTPVYVYDERTLVSQATKALAFPNSYGLRVRYAMKACPNAAVLSLFNSMGLYFDASSGHEVARAIKAGIRPSSICLSSQELPENLSDIIRTGVEFNACSLHQLESYGKLFPGTKVGIRFNPGVGSGGTEKTNVGGPAASFGIWHEYKDKVKEIAKKYNLQVVRIHTHIGSGSDPTIWQKVSSLSLNLVKEFPDVITLDLGGGYKVGRMSYEKSTDLQSIGQSVQHEFHKFAQETGRKIQLEIEPGTFLVANAGILLSTVQDIVDTSKHGYQFLKLDAGMTEVLRPSLYGAQHPIVILNNSQSSLTTTTSKETSDYVVVGHCCESGDLFTCAPNEPEKLQPRTLHKAQIGDLASIESAGAYCSAMSTKNYNSFPEAPEVMIDSKGDVHLIRRRQTLDQIVQNEVPYQK